GDGERQTNTKCAIEKRAERGTRTKQDQQVVTKHGWRQHERECDERVDQVAAGKTFAREQPRETRARNERDQRRSDGHSEGKPDGEPVDHRSWRTAYQTFSNLCRLWLTIWRL